MNYILNRFHCTQRIVPRSWTIRLQEKVNAIPAHVRKRLIEHKPSGAMPEIPPMPMLLRKQAD